MDQDKIAFIELALKHDVLKLGDFTLKSGIKSAYFFNLGAFHDGASLNTLAGAYVDIINRHFKGAFDVLFGPAYKGIPLATAIAMRLFSENQTNVAVCFDRKEAKSHGEGGSLIGASLHGKRVLIVDDVMTQGTALSGSLKLLESAGACCVGAAIALDRQERYKTESVTALQWFENQYGIPIQSIISAADLIEFCQRQPELQSVGDFIKRR